MIDGQVADCASALDVNRITRPNIMNAMAIKIMVNLITAQIPAISGKGDWTFPNNSAARAIFSK
jgi:hypothetical protein